MQFSQQISFNGHEQNPYGCACYTPSTNPESKLFLKRGTKKTNGKKEGPLMIHKPMIGSSAPRQMEVESAKISLKRQHITNMSLRSSDVNNFSINQDKLRQTAPILGCAERFPEDTNDKPKSVQLISSWTIKNQNYNRNIFQCNKQMIFLPQMIQPHTYTQTAASFTSQSSPFQNDFSQNKSPISCNSTMIPQVPLNQSKINSKIMKKISFQSSKASEDDFFLNDQNMDCISQNQQRPKHVSEKDNKITSSNLLLPPRSNLKRLKENKLYLQKMDDLLQIKSQIDQSQNFDDQESVVLSRLRQYNSSVNPIANEEQFQDDYSFTTEKFNNIQVLSTVKPMPFRKKL